MLLSGLHIYNLQLVNMYEYAPLQLMMTYCLIETAQSSGIKAEKASAVTAHLLPHLKSFPSSQISPYLKYSHLGMVSSNGKYFDANGRSKHSKKCPMVSSNCIMRHK